MSIHETTDRSTQTFEVKSYNRSEKPDRIVAGYNMESESLQKALDDAVEVAKKWNRTEPRKNMIVHLVSIWGTIREVPQKQERT